jgi:glucose/arabinose dehydrogenase
MLRVTVQALGLLCLGLLPAACGSGSASNSSGGRVAASATPVVSTATVPAATPTVTRTTPSTPSASTPTPTLPRPSATATRTATHTPTASALPTPRGDKIVDASEGIGIIRVIPGGPVVGAAPRMPAQYRVRDPQEVRVETFVSGLEVPWSLAFAPDGRLFISERPGRVRVVTNGRLDPMPWVTPPVQALGEGGLMGLALSPDFATDPWVYVCYTFDDRGRPQNRISRIRDNSGRGGAEQILLDSFPGAVIHDGCRLRFGPDGKLYATTGDAAQRSQAQDLGSLAGKILRLNPDGTVPADNPFGPASPVYTYGHRNPQGLAFHPQTGVLFATEHGPSGEVGFGAYDEVNIIVAGGNYAWPEAVGAPHLPQFHDPLLSYPDAAVPPGDATFYLAPLIPQWTGNFFFASLGAQHLQRVVLDDAGNVVAIERLFAGVYGRLREVVEGPDGALYVTTSNRDGRGTPAPDDDRVLRILPATGAAVDRIVVH